MKGVQIIKHGLTAIALISFTIGLFQWVNLDVTSDTFGNLIISGIFFLALFLTMSVYRIHWIGQRKINWIGLLLFTINVIGLLLMWLNPKNVLALWKPTVATFILLSTYTFYLKIDRKNWSGSLSKVLLLITASLFLFPLFIRTSHPSYYVMLWLTLAITTIFSIIHVFVPEKKM